MSGKYQQKKKIIHKSKYESLWNAKWLLKQYAGRKRSINDIAIELNCSWGTVKNALIKLGIERRKYTFTIEARIGRIMGGQAMKKKKRRDYEKKVSNTENGF